MRDKKKQFYLITAEENTTVDLKHLRKELGANRCLTFSTDEELYEKLKLKPGEVTPFALLNCERDESVKLVLDPKLLNQKEINFHPLDPNSTITISYESVESFVRSCGHSITTLDLSPSSSSSPPSSSSSSVSLSSSSLPENQD